MARHGRWKTKRRRAGQVWITVIAVFLFVSLGILGIVSETNLSLDQAHTTVAAKPAAAR
jgi:hypothetical protein